MSKPIVLLIRDGWGIAPDNPGNAVNAADTPNTDRILATYPNTQIQASGTAVGVRPGSQGSSEVGHLNMGAGRIVEQEVVRIDKMIESGELFETPRFTQAVEHCKSAGKKFHLIGLVQDQGVHATCEHLYALLQALGKTGVKDVCIHFLADGRDTPPQSALTYLEALQAVIDQTQTGVIASVCGRYWAMDRGENWDRTEKAYRMLIDGEGFQARSAKEAIEEAYRRIHKQKKNDEDIVETDEFIRPTVIVDDSGKPVGRVAPGDVVLHFNYRQDRAIQLTRAFVDEQFTEFDRPEQPDVFYIGLTRYYDEFEFGLVPPMNMANLLGKVLSDNHLRQLRIAEFQKFRHVTSFFNGKMVEPYPGEDRIQVESTNLPEDQKPEMSAYEVADLAVCAISEGISAARNKATQLECSQVEVKDFDSDGGEIDDTYDLIVLNFANGDMVGHTGVFEAAVKAIEAVDDCVGKVVEAVLARGGKLLITADHGNAEQMFDPESGDVQTAHSISPVHLMLVANDAANYTLKDSGKLADIAPTILQLMGIDKPAEMTADSMISQ